MPHTDDIPPPGIGVGPALLSGFAGALAVTFVNEAAGRAIPHAPCLGELGVRGLAGVRREIGQTRPRVTTCSG